MISRTVAFLKTFFSVRWIPYGDCVFKSKPQLPNSAIHNEWEVSSAWPWVRLRCIKTAVLDISSKLVNYHKRPKSVELFVVYTRLAVDSVNYSRDKL